MKKTWKDRVWGGDASTVAEARAEYRAHPEDPRPLVKYAVALYSFRSHWSCGPELLGLRPRLLERARVILQEEVANAERAEALANECDVLSTHFAWMSERLELTPESRKGAREVALELCGKGFKLSRCLPRGHHTPLLLLLTQAELLFDEEWDLAAYHDLFAVEYDIGRIRIADANQRVRVMRKLGLLWRRAGRRVRGMEWILRSIFVRKVPLAVRAKSAATLFGITR